MERFLYFSIYWEESSQLEPTNQPTNKWIIVGYLVGFSSSLHGWNIFQRGSNDQLACKPTNTTGTTMQRPAWKNFMNSFLGIDTVVHAAGVLQDGLILPNLQKVGAWKIARNDGINIPQICQLQKYDTISENHDDR